MKCTTNTEVGFFGASIRNQINNFTNNHIGPRIYVPELYRNVWRVKHLIELEIHCGRFGKNV